MAVQVYNSIPDQAVAGGSISVQGWCGQHCELHDISTTHVVYKKCKWNK